MNMNVFDWARSKFNGVCIVHRVPMVEQTWKVTGVREARKGSIGGEFTETLCMKVCPKCPARKTTTDEV